MTSKIIIVGLILIIVGLILALVRIKPDTSIENALYDTLARQDSIIRYLTDDRSKIIVRNAQERAQATRDAETYKSTIAAQNVRLNEKKRNPDVIKARDENPPVDALIVFMDSLSTFKDDRIAAQDRHIQRMTIDMDAITANFEAQLLAEQRKFAAMTKLKDDFKGKYEAEKKKTLGWKIITGLSVALAIFAASK